MSQSDPDASVPTTDHERRLTIRYGARARTRRSFASRTAAASTLRAFWLAALGLCGVIGASASAEVRVEETTEEFILANGVIEARVSKTSGDLVSLAYNGFETLSDLNGHAFAYWSHDVTGAARIETSVTIDPADNGGVRAEVSVKGVADGQLMGFGPGAPPEGDLMVDIDLRYAIEDGDSGVYAYSVFEHQPGYAAGDMTEARVAAKLEPSFNHILVDDARNGPFPLPLESQDKYVYSANQTETRAYGFANPERGLGWFMIVPSTEFLSGGPTKPELLAHGGPVVLSYWRSSHYGGAMVLLDEDEPWARVVGPILLYVNEGPSPDAVWEDARDRLAREEERWPYDWVDAPGYANAAERAEVTGRLALDVCPAESAVFTGDLHVGLTRTPYEATDWNGEERTVTWQQEAKHLQHWTRSSGRDGRFVIPDVPAGTYTLHAFADGIIGEFATANVVVTPGQVDLGELTWSPKRYGETIWEIGEADRSAREFMGAGSHFHPGQPLRYAELFPDDIDFIVGRSDASTDWYYAHTAHAEEPNAEEILPFRGVSGTGRAAPRTIRFPLDDTPAGTAVLRVAVTGSGGEPMLDVAVNGELIERVDFAPNEGALTRHQVNGIWRSRDVAFDAGLLREGENVVTLTTPEGALNSGVIYDTVRLEVASPSCGAPR